MRCWGGGDDGQLGRDGDADANVGAPVVSESGQTTALTGIVQMSAGGTAEEIVQDTPSGGFSCGVTTDKRVKCWGAGTLGQTGHGRTGCRGRVCPRYENNEAPRLVKDSSGNNADPIANMLSVSVGGAHACGVDQWREVLCWGAIANGRLGYTPTAEDITNGVIDLNWAHRIRNLNALQISAGGRIPVW